MRCDVSICICKKWLVRNETFRRFWNSSIGSSNGRNNVERISSSGACSLGANSCSDNLTMSAMLLVNSLVQRKHVDTKITFWCGCSYSPKGPEIQYFPYLQSAPTQKQFRLFIISSLYVYSCSEHHKSIMRWKLYYICSKLSLWGEIAPSLYNIMAIW